MGQQIKPVVNLLSLIVIITIFLLTANDIVQVSWSDEDCPLNQGYYERLIGDCKQMGGALVCHQTCLARFPNARHATCDYFDETRSSDKTIPFFCSCCIEYDSREREAFGKYMPLPRAEWSPSELPPSILTEDFFLPCPKSEGLTSTVLADCQIIGKPLCIQTCEENFQDLHSAFCQDRYIEEIESYVSNCVCCYRPPDTPGGSEIQEPAETTTEGDDDDQSKETSDDHDDERITDATEETTEHDQLQDTSGILRDDEKIDEQSQETTDPSKQTSTDDDASKETTDLLGEQETTDQSEETDRR